jgi:hypothetical protein
MATDSQDQVNINPLAFSVPERDVIEARARGARPMEPTSAATPAGRVTKHQACSRAGELPRQPTAQLVRLRPISSGTIGAGVTGDVVLGGEVAGHRSPKQDAPSGFSEDRRGSGRPVD